MPESLQYTLGSAAILCITTAQTAWHFNLISRSATWSTTSRFWWAISSVTQECRTALYFQKCWCESILTFLQRIVSQGLKPCPEVALCHFLHLHATRVRRLASTG